MDMKKKLDGNYTRMLPAILNKFWVQHTTKQQRYGHLPRIMKTIYINIYIYIYIYLQCTFLTQVQ